VTFKRAVQGSPVLRELYVEEKLGTSRRSWRRRRSWTCEDGFSSESTASLGHNASLSVAVAHSYTQTTRTHAPSTVRLYAAHAAVSPATGGTSVHSSCAISSTNRRAEAEAGGRTAVPGGWRGRRSVRQNIPANANSRFTILVVIPARRLKCKITLIRDT